MFNLHFPLVIYHRFSSSDKFLSSYTPGLVLAEEQSYITQFTSGAPRSWSHKEYSCFDFPVHSIFTFDVLSGSLGTIIFGNSSSVASNTRSRLLFGLSLRFLSLWWNMKYVNIKDTRTVFVTWFEFLCLLLQRHFYNPIEHLRWSFFAKIVNSQNLTAKCWLCYLKILTSFFNYFLNTYKVVSNSCTRGQIYTDSYLLSLPAWM